MLGTFDLQIVVFLWLWFVFIVTIRRVLFRQTLETLKTSLNPAISKSKTHVWSISFSCLWWFSQRTYDRWSNYNFNQAWIISISSSAASKRSVGWLFLYILLIVRSHSQWKEKKQYAEAMYMYMVYNHGWSKFENIYFFISKPVR